VFIVAIGQFLDDQAYPPLTMAADRATEITQFFRGTYGLPDTQIHLYTDAANNADEAHLLDLQKEIKRVAANDQSIVFLFVLSHGKAVQSNRYGADLLIVASDTAGNAATSESGRVLGSAFFNSFLGVGFRSIIFAFFDTCNSGSLSHIQDQLVSSYHAKDQRVVSIASSGDSQLSYDFSFTHALVQHWKQTTSKDCEYAADLRDHIHLPDQRLTLLAGDDQICLNAINPKTAMLFLLPGDAGPATVSVRDSKDNPLKDSRLIQANDYLPLVEILPRSVAKIVLLDGDAREIQWVRPDLVDFTQTPLFFQDLSKLARKTNAYSNQTSAVGTVYGWQSGIAPERKLP
jgi:hypothetical protein